MVGFAVLYLSLFGVGFFYVCMGCSLFTGCGVVAISKYYIYMYNTNDNNYYRYIHVFIIAVVTCNMHDDTEYFYMYT